MRDLPNFERISGEARSFADSALLCNWFFDDYMRCAKEAWLVVHEESLKRAQRQVAEYDKRVGRE